jgi:hypothetical protein
VGLFVLYDVLQYLKVPHLLDVMHTEKNVCAALLKTFTNCKGSRADSLALRKSMADFKMMKDFHPREDGTYEPASWIWTTTEYDEVIKLLSNVKTPFGYGSSFKHKFNDRKIVGFKTHDYHNLLHDLFPIAVRGTLTEDVRNIIYKLSSLFKWLCSKEIAKKDVWQKKIEATEILCEIEMCLPLSLLDIQFYNIVHLVEEVELCGPVSVR